MHRRRSGSIPSLYRYIIICPSLKIGFAAGTGVFWLCAGYTFISANLYFFVFCIFLSRPCFTSRVCSVMAHVWTFLLLFLLSHPEYALLWLMFGLSTPFTFSISRICCVMNMIWVFSYIFTFYVSEADICSTAHRIIVFLSSKKFANFFIFQKTCSKKLFLFFKKTC